MLDDSLDKGDSLAPLTTGSELGFKPGSMKSGIAEAVTPTPTPFTAATLTKYATPGSKSLSKYCK